MNEFIHQFGEQQRLIGVLSKPPTEQNDTCFIILNSGLLSKAGAFRFSVELARQLQANNFYSFRFDFGGIGDSETGLSSETFIERSNSEILLAMDLIQEQYGIKKFVVGGLCSAADCALQVAAIDRRVKGLLLIDPPAYKTPKYHLHHQINRVLRTIYAFDLKRWLNVFSKLSKPAVAKKATLNFRIFPSQQDMTQKLGQYLDENIQMFFAYTGGSSSYFNHKAQFFDMFPELDFSEKVTLHHLARSDHLSILKRDRDHLIKLIVEWSQSKLSITSDR